MTPEAIACSSIKAGLLEYLREQVEIANIKGKCVLTLPIKTLDDRLVSVAIEQKLTDFFLIHDSGHTVAELFSQGINLTEKKREHLKSIARSFGATLENDIFQIGCRAGTLQDSIISIAQCATLSMTELLTHYPHFEEEPLTSRVGRALKQWQPEYISNIERNVEVVGRNSPHRFDFVAFTRDNNVHYNGALKLLRASYGGKIDAERYGFLALDIERTVSYSWRRLAILARIETWPSQSIQSVKNLSRETIELRTGEEEQIYEILPSRMEALLSR